MTAPTLHTTSDLLADPAQVHLLRDLYAHARTIRAPHHTYAFVTCGGRPSCGWEHTWTAGESRVSLDDGRLIYTRRGVKLLAADVTSVRQAAQLLAAIGVIPQRFNGDTR